MNLETLIQELEKHPNISITISSNGMKCSSNPKITFETWAWQWAKNYKQGVVKDNTYFDSIERQLRLHLVPRFGPMSLDEILPIHVHEYFRELSPKYRIETQHKIKTCLHALFEAAIENHLCSTNPVSKSLKLSSQIPPYPKSTWSKEQFQTVWNFAQNHPFGLTIMVLMETGLLRSEMLGLEISDFDAEKNILMVRNGLVPAKRVSTRKVELMHQGLKNNYRKRDIPISDNLTERIRCIPREIFVGGNIKKGIPPHSVIPKFLFYSPTGKAWHPMNWFHRCYSPFMEDMHTQFPNIPILSPHELRHTRASLLNQEGVSLYDIQKLLGHRDLTMLSRRYLHTDTEALRQNLHIKT